MRKLYAAFIIALLTGFAMCYQPEPVMDYEVNITIYTHSRILLWTYGVSPSQITVTRHPTGNGPGEIMIKRGLTDSEKNRIGRFLAGFPLESLEERYADDIVTGNMHYEFDIRVHNLSKHIYVYYKSQKDLAELSAEIDLLLPKYRIGYK